MASRRRTGPRGPIRHAFAPLAVLILLQAVVVLGAGAALAAPVTHADREATYPDGVANVTHEPWSPSRGDDVVVTLFMEPDARPPSRVSLIFCRVEPDYVCGIPLFIDEQAGGGEWVGTIPWDDRFMRDDTVHVGYNLTLRSLDRETGEVERVAVPLGNHWVPEAFPTDSGGSYYFLAYQGDGGLFGALPAPLPWVALLLVICWGAMDRRRGRGHG